MDIENKPPVVIPQVQAVIDSAEARIQEGCAVYFKWTCGYCGSRQTFETPNVFCTQGKCEECGILTNLASDPAANVNYLLVAPGTPNAIQYIQQLIKKAAH